MFSNHSARQQPWRCQEWVHKSKHAADYLGGKPVILMYSNLKNEIEKGKCELSPDASVQTGNGQT